MNQLTLFGEGKKKLINLRDGANMKKFEVLLTRSYIVTILSESERQACKYVEFYLGDSPDLSKSKDRRDKKFKIERIEMTFNEAHEPKEII